MLLTMFIFSFLMMDFKTASMHLSPWDLGFAGISWFMSNTLILLVVLLCQACWGGGGWCQPTAAGSLYQSWIVCLLFAWLLGASASRSRFWYPESCTDGAYPLHPDALVDTPLLWGGFGCNPCLSEISLLTWLELHPALPWAYVRMPRGIPLLVGILSDIPFFAVSLERPYKDISSDICSTFLLGFTSWSLWFIVGFFMHPRVL